MQAFNIVAEPQATALGIGFGVQKVPIIPQPLAQPTSTLDSFNCSSLSGFSAGFADHPWFV